jgi:hypothetical protein
MPCNSCGSGNQQSFISEICIHLPGFENLSKPAVLVFPHMVVCLDCGFTRFSLSQADLRRLDDASLEAAAA